jgi:hypothetical protein
MSPATPYRGFAEWRLDHELPGPVRRDFARSLQEGGVCRNRLGRRASCDNTGRAHRHRVGRLA